MNKTATEYKKALKRLTEAIIQCEGAIDKEMESPQSPERGKRLAVILNRLTAINQSVMHFTLDYSCKKIKRLYDKQ